MSAVTTTGEPAPPPARRLLAVVLLVPVVVALALWVFAWPAARIAPQELPVGVAGQASAATQLEQALANRGDAFEVHRYEDEAAAAEAVREREVYGAVVATPRGPELLTASAASPVVAQLLQQAVQGQLPEGTEARVTDVVPAPAGDPRGAALGASVMPMAMAGVAAGALVTLAGLRGGRAAGALLGASALVGLTAAGLAHSWLGALTGDWWAEAGALGLAALAGGATVAGLSALLGRAGLGLGAALIVLLGNAFSGMSSAPEMLPQPVGALGQLLPPGAGASLLRSVAFFDGAGAAVPALTLTAWAVLGLLATVLGRPSRRAPTAAAGGERPEPRAVPAG
ncbi:MULTISPECIES: ABC transporter permease [Streptomyces]|uniref:ABC transporter permease n=1 Tax=Streptomyces lycii TaxID=2654337 RepID=A0ABQ7FP44_9ACTN|nr:ABC transporter permease [Streptomyces lycii]KAF4410477.1 ABC transporter permease [Streptomyces lycii]